MADAKTTKKKPTRAGDKNNRKNGVRKMLPNEIVKDKKFLMFRLNRLRKLMEEYLSQEKVEKFKKSDALQGNTFKFTPRELAERGMDYLQSCIDLEERPNIMELCYELGLNPNTLRSLQGFGYKKSRCSTDLFEFPVNALKGFIAACYERDGRNRVNPTFYIFLLKNLGLEDKQVVEEGESAFSVADGETMRDRLKKILSRS